MNWSQKRFILILFSICCIFNFSIMQSAQDDEIISYNLVPVVKDLEIQSVLSKGRLVVIPVIIAATLYFNHQKLIKNIKDYPLFFVLGAYCFGNYVIDSIAKYRQINQTLQFFLYSKMMSRLLLCIFAVKNKMKNLSVTKGALFNEQEFLSFIVRDTGRSIDDLEIFTFELLKSSINSISNLCIDINTSDIEEKIYFLCKDHITIEEMLLICKNDLILYDQLLQFYTNPEVGYQDVMHTLCQMLAKNFNYFLQKRLYLEKVCVY